MDSADFSSRKLTLKAQKFQISMPISNRTLIYNRPFNKKENAIFYSINLPFDGEADNF